MTVDQFVLNCEIIFSIWTQIFHFLCNLLILIVVDVMERRPCRESGSCFRSRGERARPQPLLHYSKMVEAVHFITQNMGHWDGLQILTDIGLLLILILYQ